MASFCVDVETCPIDLEAALRMGEEERKKFGAAAGMLGWQKRFFCGLFFYFVL